MVTATARGENGEFCVTVGPAVTRTVGILSWLKLLTEPRAMRNLLLLLLPGMTVIVVRMQKYTKRRYGSYSPDVDHAWQLLKVFASSSALLAQTSSACLAHIHDQPLCM